MLSPIENSISAIFIERLPKNFAVLYTLDIINVDLCNYVGMSYDSLCSSYYLYVYRAIFLQTFYNFGKMKIFIKYADKLIHEQFIPDAFV